jgi:hypothetical protein
VSRPSLTEARRRWLTHLRDHADRNQYHKAVPWSRMPKRADGSSIALSNLVWRPMIDAGWITGEYRTGAGHRTDWHFEITDAGRAVLGSTRAAG